MSIPAVAYFRMSSDRQDKSIPQQQEWAKSKCEAEAVVIEAEFRDEAISGDKTSKRSGFHQMLAYCQRRQKEGPPIEAIVCWDGNRFSRANSFETGYYIWQFMEAGVHLTLTREGWTDWNREDHRVIHNLQQDIARNRYLRDLSANIVRGKLSAAKASRFCGGYPTYGFDRLLMNERDEPQRRLKRGERVERPKGWYAVLIPTEDPEQIEVLRWLFHTFAETDVSRRSLALELNKRGVPGPQSFNRKNPFAVKWGPSSVKRILMNPRYCGDFQYGFMACGAYYRLVNGEIEENKGSRKRRPNTKGVILNRDAHEAIVDRATWERVQEKLRASEAERDPKAPEGFRQRFARAGGFVLSGGLLRCGHCGARMHGMAVKQTIKGKTYSYRRYKCWASNNRPGMCRNHTIREDRLLPFLIKKLQEVYLDPRMLQKLRGELKRQVEARRKGDPAKPDKLRGLLAKLDGEIKRATQNVLGATDNLDLLNDALSQLRQDRERLQADLAALERGRSAPVEEVGEKVDRAIQKLARLREELKKANPGQLREVLRQMISRIDLFWEEGPRKKQQWFRFAKGVIKLRPQLELESSGAPAPSSEGP